MPLRIRVRNWCFTINNYTEEDVRAVETIECKYAVYGFESGTEGTPHIQGYIEFGRALDLSVVQERLGGRAHLEPRRGSAAQAADYCKKEGDFRERGTMSVRRQGERTDINAVVSTLENMHTEGNFNLAEIAITHPREFIKYHKGISEWISAVNIAPRWRDLTVNVYYGPTGCGKSRFVSEQVPENYYKVSRGNNGIWWDGYLGQDNLILDDFDGGWFKFRHLLVLLDGHECYADPKGKQRIPLHYTTVWITTDVHPSEWYELSESKWSQLERRLTHVYMWDAEEEDFCEVL